METTSQRELAVSPRSTPAGLPVSSESLSCGATTTHLGVQVLSLHAQVGVNDVEPDEQAGDDGALLLHHQRVGLVELAAADR